MNDIETRLRTALPELAEALLAANEPRVLPQHDVDVALDDLVDQTELLVPLDTEESKQLRVPWLALAAAALLVVALGSVALFGGFGTDELPVATSAGYVAPVGLSPLPGDLSTATWTQFDEPFAALDDDQGVLVNDVVGTSDIAWAVGSLTLDSGDPAVMERERPRIGVVWTSTDGEIWQPIDVEAATINPAPEGTELNLFFEVAVTDDGTVWASGREVTKSEGVNGGVGSPILYRSRDGLTWERLEVPRAQADSGIQLASAEGNEVLLILTQVRNDEVLLRTSRTDGESFLEGREVPMHLLAVLHDGNVADILPGEITVDGWVDNLLPGPLSFVAAGASNPPSDDEPWPRIEPLLWTSTDGDVWTELELPGPALPYRLAPSLFAHTDGVFVAINWSEGDEAGAALFNVTSATNVDYLGQLPVGRFQDMFVLNGKVFLTGSEGSFLTQSPGSPNGEPDLAVWAANFK